MTLTFLQKNHPKTKHNKKNVKHSFQKLLFVVLVATACSQNVREATQNSSKNKLERPIPNPIESPSSYFEAIKNGTRTKEGKPGEQYWINSANYTISLNLFPDEKRAEATETITYLNNSPDTLNSIVVNLNLNLHKEGAIRNELNEITGGMPLSLVKINDSILTDTLRKGSRYRIVGTYLTINPGKAILPGESVNLEFAWSFAIPKEGASGRMGWSQNNLFYLAYFYPQMAVYDDIIGWHTDQFQGTAEFYSDFSDYTVSIEVPGNWLVLGTGELTNAQEVLADSVNDRMIKGHASDSVVHVINSNHFGYNATKAKVGESLTWKFNAKNVRDVAFSITKESNWDASRAKVGDLDGDGNTDYTEINTIWRNDAPRWKNAWQYAQNSIEFMSNFSGLIYPWPHMTSVEAEGIIRGGMEYPMMTIISSYTRSSDKNLYGVIAHELAHMWVPLMLSTNERRYAWMDEGFTSFHEAQASKKYFNDPNAENENKRGYLVAARYGIEGEIMRWSDYHYNGWAYGNASYSKPATVLTALRGVLGEEVFTKAYLEFMSRWQYKHPYPWDLWATFEDISGRDLNWFWRSWYFETWTLDQSIESVKETKDGTLITIKDLGNIPMPVLLKVTFEDLTSIEKTISEQVWLKGKRTSTFLVPAGKKVIAVSIDEKRLFPDVNEGNNYWEK